MRFVQICSVLAQLHTRVDMQSASKMLTVRKPCKYHAKLSCLKSSESTRSVPEAPRSSESSSRVGETLVFEKPLEELWRCFEAQLSRSEGVPERHLRARRRSTSALAYTRRVFSKATCVSCRREHFWHPGAPRKSHKKATFRSFKNESKMVSFLLLILRVTKHNIS